MKAEPPAQASRDQPHISKRTPTRPSTPKPHAPCQNEIFCKLFFQSTAKPNVRGQSKFAHTLRAPEVMAHAPSPAAHQAVIQRLHKTRKDSVFVGFVFLCLKNTTANVASKTFHRSILPFNDCNKHSQDDLTNMLKHVKKSTHINFGCEAFRSLFQSSRVPGWVPGFYRFQGSKVPGFQNSRFDFMRRPAPPT